jgi:NAD(P)-dependent dehydrogenase (short-subunit alcohol dehydrogenase family)
LIPGIHPIDRSAPPFFHLALHLRSACRWRLFIPFSIRDGEKTPSRPPKIHLVSNPCRCIRKHAPLQSEVTPVQAKGKPDERADNQTNRRETLSMSFENKVVLVTGSGNGIGRATAILFAEKGAKVIVSDIDEKMGSDCVQAIQALGCEAIFQKADLTSEKDLDALVQAALDAFGRIDVLVNNAGIGGTTANMNDITYEEWNKVLATDLTAHFSLSKRVIPLMEKQPEGGAIVNVASMASTAAGRGGLAYTAAKHGLLGLTRQMAMDHGKHGVRVNAVLPGPIDTAMIARVLAIPQHPVSIKIKMSPAGRPGSPSEVGKAILFLASEDASFIHGAGLAVDGGYTIF